MTYPVSSQLIRQQAPSKLCKNVTIEEAAEDYSLLRGGPCEILCLNRGSIVQSDRFDLCHCHNRNTQVHPQRVHIEEAEEGHKDHHVSRWMRMVFERNPLIRCWIYCGRMWGPYKDVVGLTDKLRWS